MYLAYNGLTIRAQSADPSNLNWLREFLCPFFTVVESQHCDATVSLITDSERFQKMFDRGARADGAQIDCFALESSWVRLPLWKSAPDKQTIFDHEHKVFYRIKCDGKEIEILTAAENNQSRIALMRVVREFAMIHSAQRRALLIHGAAFSTGGHCVILAGPKRAGKTTLLMHALRSGKARFLSNDRVVVSLEEDRAVARGMPTIVTIRKESLEKFPEWGGRLETTSYNFTRSLCETTDQPTRPDREGRFSLSPAQFCQFLQVTPLSQQKLGALVFPRISTTRAAMDLEPLSFEVAVSRLTDAVFQTHLSPTNASFFMFERDRELDRERLERQFFRLFSMVRCFDCHLGIDVYADSASAAPLFSLDE